MLKFGALLNFVLALGHLLCLFFLDAAFRFYGIDGEINELAMKYGSSFPYALTLVIALLFFVAGLYGLSGAGVIRKLPLLKTAILTIAAVFLLRAFAGIAGMIADGNMDPKEAANVSVALVVGISYLWGFFRKRRIG